MAVIITSLSLVRRSDEIYEYTYLQSKEKSPKNIKGIYTNCAPLRALIEEAAEDHDEENDKINIIAIVTKEVFYNKVLSKNFKEVGNEKTTFDFYNELVNQYKKRGYNIKIIPVYYGFKDDTVFDELFPSNERTSALELFKKISENSQNHKSAYIDFTGAGRDISYLMTSIVRYLGINGLNVREIVYSNINNQNRQILKIKYVYKLESVTTAVNDFVETGSVGQLKRFFEKERVSCKTEPNPYDKVCELIDCLEQMVHHVAISSIDSLGKLQEDIVDKIKEIEDDKNSDDIYVEAFKTLIPKIKDSLFIKGKDKSEFGTCEIIKWCVAHRFIQQAAVIYSERMPDEFVKMGINELVKNSKQDENFYSIGSVDNNGANGKSASRTLFYEYFFDAILPSQRFRSRWKSIQDKEPADSYESRINNILDWGWFTDGEKERIKALKNYIDSYSYSENNNNIPFGSPEKQPDKAKRINAITGGNNNDYKILENVFDNIHEIPIKGDSYIYSKKRKVICFLDGAGDNYKNLALVMKRYLAITIIRNNMSHSSTSEEESKEAEIYEECISGLKINKPDSDIFGYSSIKSVIRESIKEFETIRAETTNLICEKSWENLFKRPQEN